MTDRRKIMEADDVMAFRYDGAGGFEYTSTFDDRVVDVAIYLSIYIIYMNLLFT